MEKTISKADVESLAFESQPNGTRVSTETFPAGTIFDTLKGTDSYDVPCKLGVDSQGNIFPIPQQ